jgi:hypothetical protein
MDRIREPDFLPILATLSAWRGPHSVLFWDRAWPNHLLAAASLATAFYNALHVAWSATDEPPGALGGPIRDRFHALISYLSPPFPAALVEDARDNLRALHPEILRLQIPTSNRLFLPVFLQGGGPVEGSVQAAEQPEVRAVPAGGDGGSLIDPLGILRPHIETLWHTFNNLQQGRMDPVPPPLALQDADWQILEALAAVHPGTMHQIDLEARIEVARRTIGPRLERLRTWGLVSRPRGERGGEQITPLGLALLSRRG